MGNYIIEPGESIPSVAKDQGFFWRTLWDLPENAALKQKRKDPNVLFQGDEVFVPDLRQKQESGATEQRHRFKRKGDPVKFKLRLLSMDKPRASEDYVLEIDGKLIRGKTDADGKLEEWIPGNAEGGKITLKGGAEVYPVQIGHLDPVDETSGIQQRLNNLGFLCGTENGEIGPQTRQAICAFQAKHELKVTGEPDEATKAKLQELHP
jgi:hypothetical protein